VTTDPGRIIETRYVFECLDHLGVCAACGYPSRAHTTTTVFLGGDHESVTTVECGMDCGWREQHVTPETACRNE